MKFGRHLRSDIDAFKEYVVLVEGKHDVAALEAEGFENVHAIHVTGVGLRERIEEIVAGIVDRKRTKVCILTDLDKEGKKLYLLIKPILSELGVRLDSRLRGILLKAKVSHIESFGKFMEKIED